MFMIRQETRGWDELLYKNVKTALEGSPKAAHWVCHDPVNTVKP